MRASQTQMVTTRSLRPIRAVSSGESRLFKRAIHAAAGLYLLVGSTACIFHRAAVRTARFVIVAGADANDNAPTKVDAVMVYDRAILPSLLGMSAKQWFARRDQLKNDSPAGFESREWELVPGTVVDVTKLPFHDRGVALIVFANYPGPGDHRARLDGWRMPRILLGDRTLAVVEQP